MAAPEEGDVGSSFSVVDRIGVPESVGGVKLNSILAYSTPRMVTIEDRRLGCCYYLLVLLVIVWVIGFQIMYGNEHYQLFDVLGESRMTIQQPTVKGCNPRKEGCEDNVLPFAQLPYCEDSSDDDKFEHSSACTYADMVDLVPNGMAPNSLFVPTRIDSMTQQQGCTSGNPEEACQKMWTTTQGKKNVYVAGIETYTLMIRSSYLRKGIRGHSFSHVGFYYQCTDADGQTIKTDPCEGTLELKEIKCRGKKCKRIQADGGAPPLSNGLLEVGSDAQSRRKLRSTRHRSPSQSLLQANNTFAVDDDDEADGDEVFSVPSGDIFTMRKLLELAGLDLDASLDDDGAPLRQRGTAITVNIEYTNMRPFGMFHSGPQIGYAYRIVEQPLDEVKEELYSAQQQRIPGTRVMENRHGILLTGKVTGSFGKFNIVYFLVMLTTSLALLSVAQKTVDFIALYLPSKQQQQYNEAKYLVVKPLESDSRLSTPAHKLKRGD